MAQFIYQVRDSRGAMANGALAAATMDEASRTLRGEGNVIVDLREQSASSAGAGRATPGRRVRRDDVIFFANQLAVLVDTGVPLPDALDSIVEQTTAEGFRLVLQDVTEQVKSGAEFSVALKKYPKVFGRLFVAMVKASEASGTMGKMLQRVSRYLEQQRQVLGKVRGAMAYPVAMIGFCILVLIAMLTFILPRFEKIYSGKAAVLPLPTRVLLGMSKGLIAYWPVILVLAAATGVGLWLFFRRNEGKVVLDRLMLRLPVIGPMCRKAVLARSLRTLATMVSTGVSVLDSMEITADVAGNYEYEQIWRSLGERLKEGSSLSEEMRKYPLLPRSVSQMVAAGEKTGKLGTVMDRAAGFCEEDLETAIRTATSFIEPVMIVIMGIIVGGIAMALLLPIFSLSKIVAH